MALARITQLIIETASTPGGESRVSQLAVEAMWVPGGEARVTQLCIEIIRPDYESGTVGPIVWVEWPVTPVPAGSP